MASPEEPELTSPAEPEPVTISVNGSNSAAATETNGTAQEKKEEKGKKEPLPTGEKKNDRASFWRLTAFYFFVLLFLLFVLIFFSLSSPSPSDSSLNEQQNLQLERSLNVQNRSSSSPPVHQHHCTTDACQAAANSIAASMDFGADPCLDFYNYSCGRWAAVNRAAIDAQQTYLIDSNLVLLAGRVNDQLKRLLNDTELTSKFKAKSVVLAGALYRQCLSWREESTDETTLTYKHYEPLQRVMASIFGGADWPILQPASPWGYDLWNNVTTSSFASASYFLQRALVDAVIRLTSYDSPALVEVFIDINLGNRSGLPLFYFTAPNEVAEDRPLFSDPKAYKDELSKRQQSTRLAMNTFYDFAKQKRFNSESTNNEESSNKTEKEETENYKRQRRLTIFKRAQEVFELERELALATSPPEVSNSPMASLHWMSLRQLKEELLQSSSNSSNNSSSSSFDWSIFIDRFWEQFDLETMNITEDTVVGVSDLAYFRSLTAIFARTPLYVLYNYLGTKLVTGYFSHPEVESSLSTENWCLHLVTSQLDQAVSRLYVEAEVGISKAAETKRAAEEMVNRMRRSFRSLLATDTVWLDEETRKRALEKEAATRYETGYPDWLLDDRALDEHYGIYEKDEDSFLVVDESNFLGSVLSLKHRRVATFASQKRGFLFRSVKIGASNINAFALLFTNQIVLPLALLQQPLFDMGRPAYLNTASLGATIGHEAVHHFDSNGRTFGADGSLMGRGTTGWWTSETEAHFEEAARCFVAQYDAVVDPWTGKQLRGNATLGENMADHGGLGVAYGAAFGAKKDDDDAETRNGNQTAVQLLLPGKLETFTTEQLFFVAYAQTYCTDYHRVGILAYQIDSDEHSPARYRVNQALASFAPFSAAFHCPAEGDRSVMNAAQKRCG